MLAFRTRFGKLPSLKITLQRLTQRCYLLAMVAGLLLAMAFPKWSIAGFAWFAPGLLLYAAMGQGRKKGFRTGYAAGLVMHLVSLYWLLYMPVTFWPILLWLALCAYCAIYAGLWAWLSWKLFPITIPPAARGADFRTQAEQFLRTSWSQRLLWATSCAALWVALEIILGRFLTGFPWLFLGMTQYRMIPLIQIGSFTGVYGVSFFVVWFSVSLFSAGVALVQRPTSRWIAMAELAAPMLVLACVCGWGLSRSLRPESDKQTLSVALVQPSVPQTLIWDAREDTNRFDKLVQLTEEALKSKPQLLIWPEGVVPGLPRYDQYVSDAVAKLAVEHGIWIILGADDIEPRKGAINPKEVDHFNSSFLVSPGGRLMERYVKRRLVIFGEYLPFERALPFLKYLTPVPGSFTPGNEPVPFVMTEPRVKTSVLICFEDVFPHVAREYVDQETDFLVNITNDGWFGESAEQWQQAANAVFRAVENDVPLVRSTNNGLTCLIDGNGRLQEYRFGEPASVYGAGHVTIKIPLLGAGQKRALTFYTRHGDWFGWGCVVLAALLLAIRRRGPIAV